MTNSASVSVVPVTLTPSMRVSNFFALLKNNSTAPSSVNDANCSVSAALRISILDPAMRKSPVPVSLIKL